VADSAHILKFKATLRATNNVTTSRPSVSIINGRAARGTGQVILTITSAALVSGLADKGVHPRKTWTLSAFAAREDLQRHYWRGAVDGDGWICRPFDAKHGWRTGLVGTRSFVESYADCIAKQLGRKVAVHQAGSIWGCAVSGNHAAATVLEYLYRNSTVSLDRKYAMAMDCIAGDPGPRELIAIGGVLKTQAEWLRYFGLRRVTFQKRVLRGWPVIDALSIPVTQHRAE
jgi:hypothetical protein